MNLKTKLFLILVMLPLVASADEYGTLGENATWRYDGSTKTLTISGTGDMPSPGPNEFGPWWSFYADVVNVVIEDGLTSIAPDAFSCWFNLTSVAIGDSVKRIDATAFSGCSSLTSVTIPNSVYGIGTRAFADCDGLTSITIPEGVKWIGEGAFSGCSGLTSITIPSSVTTIFSAPFSDCFNLASISVEAGNTTYDSRDNCNAIIETATNTLINGCKNTKIPNSVTDIASYAFKGCVGLISIIIPNSVTTLGGGAFWSCTGLRSVTLPNSITVIEKYAFNFCFGLTSISIPNSVTKIGGCAFSGCTRLSDVYCHAENVPETGGDAFLESNIKNATLHVPAASVNAYKAAGQWYNFKSIVALENETKPVKGNLNGDDVVDANDLLMLLDMITGKLEVTAAADVNGDGKVDVADVVKLVSIILGE